MTREILFRGKRTDNGEWVEGYYSPVNIPITGNMGHFINVGGYRAVEIDPETVGQFTGLCDKNGVRIFEGDIIEFEHPYNGKSIHAVVQNYCGWNLSNFYASCFDCPGYAFSEGTEYMTVIGNIYDNPELLEVSGNE